MISVGGNDKTIFIWDTDFGVEGGLGGEILE